MPHTCPSGFHPWLHMTRLSSAAAIVLTFVVTLLLASCSSQKFLREGESVLSDVSIHTSDPQVKPSAYRAYVQQHPNSKWFTLFKVPLGIYCLSKADSVKGGKGLSGVWRKMGEAPVVYDPQSTARSSYGLRSALQSEGYLHAEVDTATTRRRHKVKVDYTLRPGMRHYISEVRFHVADSNIRRAVAADSAQTFLHRGHPLNLNVLAQERGRIIRALRNRGYYFVNNDYVSFDIDTLARSTEAAVSMNFQLPQGVDTLRVTRKQRFRQVDIYEDILTGAAESDSTYYRGLDIHFHPRLHHTRRLYASHVSVLPDSLFSETRVKNTYANLNSLPTIGFTNLKITPVASADSLLDCQIYVKRNAPNSVKAEIEGTNTSGDFGAAVAFSYSNRNLLKGAEQLTLKVRGAYEAITGLEGYSNQNYTEWSTELGLRFPTLLIPLVPMTTKWKLKASSNAQLMYDMQDRPEFHRRVLTGAWNYRWSRTEKLQWEHRYDLLSLNYVYMPWISDTFRKDYLQGDDPHYAVLRYSYENLFIMKTGYSFTYNSLRRDAGGALPTTLYQTNGMQIRCGVELAGNLLYGLSRLLSTHRDANGQYNLFGIAYSQYAKFDFDFAKSFILNERNSLAAHVGFGIGLPFGNSTILPYEKRYFAGGANSVRGWSVRELGPGAYHGKDGIVDFVNQTGNMKLDLNLELRTHLFWKLHAALFIDAGNVWNTRDYPDMTGALFRFDRFYKQIALAYGLGIRLNFDYFILRFDGGMKAINPSVEAGAGHYPIIHPRLKRDLAMHFAVGLPF